MTRRDYVAIAAALAAERACWTKADGIFALTSAANRIADVMSRDNPRFDRERFLAACGVQ